VSRGQGNRAVPAVSETGRASRGDLPDTAGGSRARRIAFRTLAVLVSLWVLARVVFGLLEVGLMWLPYETLAPILEGHTDSATELEAHRSHFMSIGILAWAVMLAVVVQVRRPHRREAPMAWAIVFAVSSTILHGLNGTTGQWLLEEGTLLLPILALAMLHPRARYLYRLPTHDRSMAGLAIVAAVPWLVFAVTQAQHQWRNLAGDIHAEPEHWAIVALMSVTITAAALIGAGDRRGWRLPAWFAAIASIIWAVHSLVFPTGASAAAAPWAIAAICWGIAFAAAIHHRHRREATETGVGSHVASPSPGAPETA